MFFFVLADMVFALILTVMKVHPSRCDLCTITDIVFSEKNDGTVIDVTSLFSPHLQATHRRQR